MSQVHDRVEQERCCPSIGRAVDGGKDGLWDPLRCRSSEKTQRPLPEAGIGVAQQLLEQGGGRFHGLQSGELIHGHEPLAGQPLPHPPGQGLQTLSHESVVAHDTGPDRAVVLAAVESIPVGAVDANVEVVVMGGGVGRLLEGLFSPADQSRVDLSRTGMIEEELSNRPGDEHPLDYRLLGLEHERHEVPGPLHVQQQPVLTPAVAPERDEPVEPQGLPLPVLCEEGNVDVTPRLVRLALDNLAPLGQSDVADLDKAAGMKLGQPVRCPLQQADEGLDAVVGVSPSGRGDHTPGATVQWQLCGVAYRPGIGLAFGVAAGCLTSGIYPVVQEKVWGR